MTFCLIEQVMQRLELEWMKELNGYATLSAEDANKSRITHNVDKYLFFFSLSFALLKMRKIPNDYFASFFIAALTLCI